MRGARTATLLALALASAASGCQGGGSTKAGGEGPPLTLRIGTHDFETDPSGRQIRELAQRVEALSNGALRLEPVWRSGGEVPDWDQRVARRVASGELDLGLIPSRAWDTEGVTSLRALNAPFLITSDELLADVVSGELADELLAGLERAGVVGLALFPEGLRHPFAFAGRLLEPADYRGAAIRSPTSRTTAALFAALGAHVNDDAPDPGAHKGMESSYFYKPNGTAVGNVSFFPKANVLVVDDAAFDRLTGAQRRILEQAAAATRAWAIGSLPSDVQAARAFCAGGGSVILASTAQIAALRRATRPVYAMLERDAATKRLITRIRALAPGAAKAAASAPVACGGRRTRSSRAAVSGDPGVLDGVYRYELTDVLLRASGVTDAGGLAENHGVYTWTLSDGEWCWEARAPNPQQNPDDCGTYTVAGNELTFDLPDLGPVTYRWETTGDGDLRLAIVRVPTDFEPFARATVARPWRRVADAPAAAGFPEGAYRSELKEEFLRDRGISKSDAVAAEGIQTLTFRDGRWSHATDDNVTTPPTCEGPYSVEGSRVVLRFDATVDRCGVAGFELFSARWQLKGRVLRLLDVRAGDQDADSFARVVWGGRPWQRVG